MSALRVGPVILKLRELMPFFIFILCNDFKNIFIKNVAKKIFLSKSFFFTLKETFNLFLLKIKRQLLSLEFFFFFFNSIFVGNMQLFK